MLHPDRDLRHQRIAIDHVAGHTQLCAIYVLVELIAVAKTERGADALCIQRLPGVTELDAVEQAKSESLAIQPVILKLGDRYMSGAANAIAGFVAGNQTPAGQAAAGGTFDRGDAVGQQQLAALSQFFCLEGLPQRRKRHRHRADGQAGSEFHQHGVLVRRG